MPKERRNRAQGHQSSVKLPKRVFAGGEKAVEHIAIGSAVDVPADAILQSMSGAEDASITLTKKEKQAFKKEAFLQKLELSRTHSKSHERRMKRKAREQIGANGLTEMQTALVALEDHEPEENIREEGEAEAGPSNKQTASAKSLRIGAGKSATLSRAQRKKTLQLERLRQPFILTNPSFSSNPFSTVRLHAQNTLIKRQAPAA